ncbi:MAG: hypothetical protein IT579_21960 [Verrucomicrobia subdivision 3 bacterium]|nr:hypothetical protein [Limisphaerales bacterium]
MKNIDPTFVAVALLGMIATAFATDAAPPTLPAVETVLERLTEHSQMEEANELEFKQRYQFTRSRVTEVRNSKGELNKREVKTQLNRPALTPGRTEAAAGTQTNRHTKPGRKSDFVVDRDFLQRFDFTLIGREPINGRPALILDIVPAKKKPPEHNLKDRIINKIAGRVWVDEAESVLVQADFHLTEKVNVIAGLVGAIASFSLSFNRERTSDGLWFTPRMEWHLDGREVLVRRTVDSHEEITAVQLARLNLRYPVDDRYRGE